MSKIEVGCMAKTRASPSGAGVIQAARWVRCILGGIFIRLKALAPFFLLNNWGNISETFE